MKVVTYFKRLWQAIIGQYIIPTARKDWSIEYGEGMDEQKP
jgi:hypothetical protein